MVQFDKYIDLRKASIRAGNRIVLKQIQFEIVERELVYISAMKHHMASVLLEALYGLHTFIGEHARVLGEDMTAISRDHLKKLRQRIGFISSPDNLLFQDMSAKENLVLSLKYRGGELAVVDEMLDVFNLREVADLPVFKLADFQKSLVIAAREMAHRPAILLVDCNKINLTSESEQMVFDQILSLLKNFKTCCISSPRSLNHLKTYPGRHYKFQNKILTEVS